MNKYSFPSTVDHKGKTKGRTPVMIKDSTKYKV
jgi:hypothetical protein